MTPSLRYKVVLCKILLNKGGTCHNVPPTLPVQLAGELCDALFIVNINIGVFLYRDRGRCISHQHAVATK